MSLEREKDTIELLSPACREPLEIHVKQLAGEALTSGEQALLREHLVSCESCRQLQRELLAANTSLQDAFKISRVSAGFAQRTMDRLPRAATAEVSNSPSKLKVYGAQPQRRYWKTGMAAAVIAAVVTLSILRQVMQPSPIKGVVIDDQGQVASDLKAGVNYTAKQDSVFALGEHGSVKAQAGTQFQLAKTTSAAAPALNLKNGDVFAATKDEREPMKISCSAFETDLQPGDYYVAGQESDEPRGVIIVFHGFARVMSGEQREALPLMEGQIYVTSGRGPVASSDMLNINDVRHETHHRSADRAGMRRDYKSRVEGYRRELESLKTQLANTEEGQHAVELRERMHRVEHYLEAHQHKLKTLEGDFALPFPFDEIERGLNGHSDPSTWM